MTLSRRRFLQTTAVPPLLGALPFGVGCGGVDPVPVVFIHGVASGDPTPTAAIIWTRVTSMDPATPVEVVWEVSSNDFDTIAATGTFTTDATRDFTVKVDVTGLTPGTKYQYRFTALGETSRVGTFGLPVSGALESLRLGVVSCSSLAHGYFHAYRALAAEDVDAVLHLGDYIYEYGTAEYGEVREYEPAHEILSLDDYRMRCEIPGRHRAKQLRAGLRHSASAARPASVQRVLPARCGRPGPCTQPGHHDKAHRIHWPGLDRTYVRG